MTVTASGLQTRFPAALGSVATAVLDLAIAEAYALNDATTLASRYDLAVTYHAAHLALIDRRAASDGIASASADGVSTAFDHSSAAATFLEMYKQIVNGTTLGSGAMVSSFAAWGF